MVIIDSAVARLRRWRQRRGDQRIIQEIALFAQRKSSVMLIQVGSNDGIANDPFYEHIKAHGWAGILVEPVPYVFARLRRLHRSSDNIVVENLAISVREEEKQFFYLREKGEGELPWWYDQIGSFSLEQVLKSKGDIPNLEKYVTSSLVKCVTLPQLLKKHNVRSVAVLHTDCEGYDFEVLKQLDFSIYKPTLILYEHKHLRTEERRASECILRDQGYELISGSVDTLAVSRGVIVDIWNEERMGLVP